MAEGSGADGEPRMQYTNKLELILTLVGYAVGLGNVWRFPYLAFSYGGGAFLIPYALSLLFLGWPLFVLELGLGQMFRQGTLGVWTKLGLARLRGVGTAATISTFVVSLYYNVILAWTVYYLGRTLGATVSGSLPWDDQIEGYSCAQTVLYPHRSVANSSSVVDAATGLFNHALRDKFWCPESGLPTPVKVPDDYVRLTVQPSRCPAAAAMEFWEMQAMQQSSGLDDLGGFHSSMLLSYTIAWVLVYLCICKGIASSGKVVYVTATLPYVALIIFFFRAVTLPNAGTGVGFYLKPDLSILLDGAVWLRAVNQIFYSLGVGFGSLIAFASYGKKDSDYARDALTVSLINCGTSFFAGFVVFPVLGFLAHELADINPCIQGNDLKDLSSVGLSGTGLAFIAFPIAISQMPGSFFWAFLFFCMLLCLGIDSQFAMCESVVTVLRDAGADRALERWMGRQVPKPVFSGLVCLVSYLLGLIFVTRGGLYWFELFDYYTCVVGMFFVTLLECVGLMWYDRSTWITFTDRTKAWTGRQLGRFFLVSWKFICPTLLSILVVISFLKWDLMGAADSKPFPEGSGYLPGWSILVGWALGILPVLGFVSMALIPPPAPSPAPVEPKIVEEDFGSSGCYDDSEVLKVSQPAKPSIEEAAPECHALGAEEAPACSDAPLELNDVEVLCPAPDLEEVAATAEAAAAKDERDALPPPTTAAKLKCLGCIPFC